MFLWIVGCGGSSSTPAPTPTPTPSAGAATVTTTSSTVPLSTTQLFTANNFSAAVTWSVNPAIGTIDPASGLYHAPATFPSPNTATVTATAGTQSASANITIVFPNDNSTSQATPVKLGTSGGNVNDVANGCCIGTMGSLWTRPDLAQPVILSNNHVLDKSSFGTPGDSITQPGPSLCFGGASKPIAALTFGAPLKPTGVAAGGTGPSPSNTDSAIAQIVPGAVDLTGSILDLGATPGASSIPAAPPSSTIAVPTLGMAVAKSGRTTGLTCSTVSSIKGDFQVKYFTSCGSTTVAFIATYSGQIVINGGSFSGEGDSGSLVVNSANAQPVALLYAGSPATATDPGDTVANPLLDDIGSNGAAAPGVITALSSGANKLTIVGGTDHPVSCQPTFTVPASTQGGAFSTDALSATERQHITTAQQKNSGLLMQNSAVSSVSAGGSADSPGEGALIIHLSHASAVPIPPVMDGVRTRVVFDQDGLQPTVGQVQIDHAAAVKDAHVSEYLGQPGIQGVAVSISSDNPAETAISIYVIKGVSHQIIPAVIDGVRTKIFEGEAFRAY